MVYTTLLQHHLKGRDTIWQTQDFSWKGDACYMDDTHVDRSIWPMNELSLCRRCVPERH